MGSGKLVNRVIKKYGIDNFTKEILFVFSSEEEMNAKEKELVIVSEETYNLCEGGKGGFGYINSNFLNKNSFNDPEIRNKAIQKSNNRRKILALDINWQKMSTQKMTSTMYKRYGSEAFCTFKGKTHTEETKAKISKSNSENHMGNKNPQYGTCWVTNGIQSEQIKKEDIDIWMKLGYSKGRKIIRAK